MSMMTIKVYDWGEVEWFYSRKSYRKARWKKAGQRLLNDFLKQSGAKGIIYVKG